jgi:tyrosyl-tRNA synthetase
VDLIRRVEGVTVEAMTYQLLTTASGVKMGKTAAGAVCLDKEKLGASDYYQYWVNCDDRDVVKLLKIFTLLPLNEINRLAALEGADIREAKQVLAYEATKITHGQEAADNAQRTARTIFGRVNVTLGHVTLQATGVVGTLPTTTLPWSRLEQGLGILEIFTEVGLTQSRGEARRLVQQGGVYVNDARIDQAEAVLTPKDVQAGAILLRAGKKKYHRLIINS